MENTEAVGVETPAQLKHNHGPNFGRFVKDCPRCEQVGPKVYESKRKPAQEHTPEPMQPQGVYLTFEQLQELMEKKADPSSNGELKEALEAFATKLMAGNPDEIAKKEAEAKRKEEARARRIAEVRVAEEAKAMREQMCEDHGHVKENGKTAIVRGQAYNDNFYKPFCLVCGKDFKPIPATVSTMTEA